MIMFAKHTDIFTPPAARRWNQMSQWAQEKILAHIWCGNCRKAVRIVLKNAKMEQGNLMLRGKCGTCGGKVCRVVEPEDE